MSSLNKKERLFVEAYVGDVAAAARIAGYEGSDDYMAKKGQELFSNPKIQKAIVERSKYEVKTHKTIADRKERMEWWTALMRNSDPHVKTELDEFKQPIPEGNIPLSTRLAASDKLAKAEGDFITNVNVNGSVTITDLVAQSYSGEIENEDLDAIEAEYNRLRGDDEITEEEEVQEVKSSPKGLSSFL